MELNKQHELHSAVLYLYVMMTYNHLTRNYLSMGSVYGVDHLLPFENPLFCISLSILLYMS